jgi:DUF1680 family protein
VSSAQLRKGYLYIDRPWQKLDRVTLELDMRVNLIESHPLVEETRNQVAVMRGPLVYCLESADLSGSGVFNVAVPVSAAFTTADIKLSGSKIRLLETMGKSTGESWSGGLYRSVQKSDRMVPLRFIPYFAWANRGMGDMSVWLPIDR